MGAGLAFIARSLTTVVPTALAMLAEPAAVSAVRVVFICTRNSARSPLAAALWANRSTVPATSAGTRPGPRVHRRAITTGRRHGLASPPGRTAHVRDVVRPGDLVVAVCDNAYEELGRHPKPLHWSVPDPARDNTEEAFEHAFEEIESRIGRLTAAVQPSDCRPRSRDEDKRTR